MSVYSGTGKVGARVITETFNVVSGITRVYSLDKKITTGSIHLTINGLENFEGIQFLVVNKTVVFKADCALVKGDFIDIRYNY